MRVMGAEDMCRLGGGASRDMFNLAQGLGGRVVVGVAMLNEGRVAEFNCDGDGGGINFALGPRRFC